LGLNAYNHGRFFAPAHAGPAQLELERDAIGVLKNSRRRKQKIIVQIQSSFLVKRLSSSFKITYK
jgi:hypothetical protein